MRRERIADDIYVFISERYAQVTMGAILTEQGAVVIDTFPFPQETSEVLDFIQHLAVQGVRYVINTHYHADHTYGNYLFAEAEIIAHRLTRETLARLGPENLAKAKQETNELADVQIRLPDLTFETELYVHLGGRTLHLMHTPGHTDDSIVVMVEGDKILFTGDTVMPVPYIVWGDQAKSVEALQFVQDLRPENIVQGHGDILLRGELRQDIEDSICYLNSIYERVKKLIDNNAPESRLAQIDIETCGKSRIPLDGLVRQLHQANLLYLYRKLKAEKRKR